MKTITKGGDMWATLRVLVRMGGLQRLFPLWLLALGLCIFTPSVWYVPAVMYGVVLQFFVEYIMHRFLLHRDPPQDQSAFNALYRSHIGHHEFPNDPEFFTGDDHWYAFRFALVSLALHTIALWPFLGLAMSTKLSAVALFMGSVSAFAFYEYCHTLAHLNVPKGWFGKTVTQSHLRHHFNDHGSVFHVSLGMGWIDRMWGTDYDVQVARERYDPKLILSMGMDPEDLRLVTARKAFGIKSKPRA